MKIAALTIVLIGLAIGTAQVADPSESRDKETLKERLWNGNAYDVGFLTLVGCPMEWHEQSIVTVGYLSPMPGKGLRMSLAPPDLYEASSRNSIGVGVEEEGRNGELLDLAIHYRLYVRVTGKFIMLSHGSVPAFAGHIDANSIVVLNRELRKR